MTTDAVKKAFLLHKQFSEAKASLSEIEVRDLELMIFALTGQVADPEKPKRRGRPPGSTNKVKSSSVPWEPTPCELKQAALLPKEGDECPYCGASDVFGKWIHDAECPILSANAAHDLVVSGEDK